MILFMILVASVFAETFVDYQMYTNSIGKDYSRVHFPQAKEQTTLEFNSRSSYSPLISRLNGEIVEHDVKYLFRNEVSVEKYFGKGDVNPFIAGQIATEVNIGSIPQQKLLQDRNVIVGASVGSEDDIRVAAGVVTGTGFKSKEQTTGLFASTGFSGEKFGVAGSLMLESITETETAKKASVGTYYEQNDLRLTLEYDHQFDGEYNPVDVTIGARKTIERNQRDISLFSSFSFSPTSTAGTGPTIGLGITFNLQKNKKKPVVEEKEDIKQPEEEETIIDVAPETIEESDQIEEIVEINEEKPIIPTESADEPVVTSSQDPQEPIGVLNTKQGNYNKKVKSKIKSQKGDDIMPDDNGKELKSHEVQPVTSGVSTDGLSSIAQQTGGDSNLAMFLAIIAVVGGGAAWKFYSQFAEQKHEQKMKEMEIQAKAQGLGSASPPPCQAAQAEMKAEIQSMKVKMNSTAAMLEDVDFGMYERKLKKLDKRLKALEDPEEE